VLTASSACLDARYRTVLLSLLLMLAVVDTWFDELWVSGVLGVVHFGVLWFGCVLL
jgi:hypothetical protein